MAGIAHDEVELLSPPGDASRRKAQPGVPFFAPLAVGLSWVVALLSGACTYRWVLRPPEPSPAEPLRIDLASRRAGAELQQKFMIPGLAAHEERKKWAFVMMAYTPPDEPIGESFWGALAMARAIQRLSAYPALLLTNTTHLPDGRPVKEALKGLNVEVIPVFEIVMPQQMAWSFSRWNIAFWKLQVFRLTRFEKLVWVDTDSIIYRSVDWLFERDGMWAQRDDWFCKLNQTRICSGLLLLYPSMDDFNGLLDYAEEVGDQLHHGDQQLISMYFSNVRKRPVNLLSDVEATFGQCVGSAPSPYRDSDGEAVAGMWNVPAFVHKSGGWGDTNNNVYSNVCFSPDVARQRQYIGESVLNVCHFHPLGAYWREHFCEALERIQLSTPEFASFCSGSCYYSGRHNTDPDLCLATSTWLSGPVDSSLPAQVYEARTRGLPGPEVLRMQATYHSDGGMSGPTFEQALRYGAAFLPAQAPLTLTARIHTASPARCQNIIAWSSAAGAAEFRVNNGQLLYGERSNGIWSDVNSHDLKLTDGHWHTVAVMRDPKGEVALYADGKLAHRGRLQEPRFPTGLAGEAISARGDVYRDCVFQGLVNHLHIYSFALTLEQLKEVTAL